MIVITVQGRLAHQPEVQIGRGKPWAEFRLLSNRYAHGEEHVEAVTFVCFGDEAERFCELTQKGQVINATGTQETRRWTDQGGQQRTSVRYVLTWWQAGPRPRSQQPATPPPRQRQEPERERQRSPAQARAEPQEQRDVPPQETDSEYGESRIF